MRRHLSNLIGMISILLVSYGCKQDRPSTDVTSELTRFSQLLDEVALIDSSGQYALVDKFIDSIDFPYFENDSTVFFLYYGDASNVSVAGDFSSWNPSGLSFTQVRHTQLWYRKETFESNARLDYKLVINGSNWILDPRNPNRIDGGFGPNSELAMPAYNQPEEINKREGIPEGTIATTELRSDVTGKTYTLYIYLPPDYDNGSSYPTAYFQDGADYLNLAKAGTVMDNLIEDGLIRSIIGVFVVPNDRNVEYAFDDRFDYSSFFVSELVPFIDTNYSTEDQPESRAVIGDSYGANISAIIAFQNPSVFGNCGIHSGAFQPNSFHTNSIVMDGVQKDIKVVSIWGSYEGASLPANMEKVKDYLLNKGYNVSWKELPEGHSWGLWRATLDDMLIHFFPANK